MVSLWEDFPLPRGSTTTPPLATAEDPSSSSHPHHEYRVLLAASSASEDDTEPHQHHWPQLPLGRAKHYPPLGATACPTTVKAPPPNNNHNPHKPFTQLAVVGLVLDATGQYVLLTRRPSYMRSFPGAWVLPGGGFDPDTDASLHEALEREIWEETGLTLQHRRLADNDDAESTTSNSHNNSSRPLCLWESCYPTDPHCPGPIKAHHLVVFRQAFCGDDGGLNDTATTAAAKNLPKLTLQESEVDSALWLSVDDFRQVLAQMHERDFQDASTGTAVARSSPLETSVAIYQADGSVVQGSLETLVGIYPQPEQPGEQQQRASSTKNKPQEWCGIAQGSLFALEELLRQSGANKTNTDKPCWVQNVATPF